MSINVQIIEHRLVTVDDQGHSRLLAGELDAKRPTHPTEDMLPSYLSTGWKVVNMTAFSGSSTILVLLQKELNVVNRAMT